MCSSKLNIAHNKKALTKIAKLQPTARTKKTTHIRSGTELLKLVDLLAGTDENDRTFSGRNTSEQTRTTLMVLYEPSLHDLLTFCEVLQLLCLLNKKRHIKR